MITSPIIPVWLMGIICIILIILKSKNIKTFIRQLVIVILLFMINLRIMLPSKDAKVLETNLDVFFVIDNTISMVAEDYNKDEPRIDGVLADCEYIVEELAGSNFSVITFSNEAKVQTPPTKDSDMTIAALKGMRIIDPLYAKGSSMNVVIEELENSLQRISEKEGRNSIVFFISDGEITNEDKLQSFAGAKKYIADGAVLGYGTEEGGKMKAKDIFTEEEEYLEDNTVMTYPYPKAISKIDEGNLKQIADDMGIKYIHMTKQSDVKSKVEQIRNDAIENLGDSNKKFYNDIYFIFVIPLLGMLIYEMISYKKKL